MILSHNSALSTLDGILPCDGPRPSSLSRHHNETPSPLAVRDEGQLLSFHILTNAPFRNSFPLTILQMPGGYGVHLHFPNVPTLGHSDVQTIFPGVFSTAYALFQVTYPVTPVFATLTKTAGCIPTIPILELTLGTPISRLASCLSGPDGSFPFRPAPVLSCGRNLLLKTYD